MPHRRPTLIATASALGLHPRALQRRLDLSGVPFEGVLDEARRIRALELLHARKHSMTEIAFLLGYSDAAHFTRAFRRGTGTAPSRFNAIMSTYPL